MRNPDEREVALRCLALAVEAAAPSGADPVDYAERFYVFVSGDDAADKLAAVRKALT